MRLLALAALVLLATTLGAAAPAAAPGCELFAVALVNPGDFTSLEPCPGIGPGSALVFRFDLGGGVFIEETYCSMAFLVTDGDDLYVSTAGHCVEDSLGVPSLGDRVSAHGIGEFGTVVHQWCEGQAANGGCGAGADFGLILIDDDKRDLAHADVCRWSAPSSTFTAQSGAGFVQHFGWGAALGSSTHLGFGAAGVSANPGNPITQARQGILVDPQGFGESAALIETAGAPGDSGSGVLATASMVIPGVDEPASQALGVFTHVSVGGIGVVQRLDASLARASDEMGKDLRLYVG